MQIAGGETQSLFHAFPADAMGTVRVTLSRGWGEVYLDGENTGMTTPCVLEDVRVPASAMFPNVQGLKGPLGCLTQARYGISWGAVGAALACFDEALSYSKDRIVFDRPLASFQIPQRKLADVATPLETSELTRATRSSSYMSFF